MGRPPKSAPHAPPDRASAPPKRRRLPRLVLVALLVAGLGALLGRYWDQGEEEDALQSTSGPAPVGEWPPEVVFVPHTVPAMIKNEIAAAGQRQGYQFDGRAGQVWALAVEPEPDSTLDPLLSLYGPSGALLASSDDRSAEDLSAALTITLPESGTYRAVVESSAGGLTTGAYLLTLWPQR